MIIPTLISVNLYEITSKNVVVVFGLSVSYYTKHFFEVKYSRGLQIKTCRISTGNDHFLTAAMHCGVLANGYLYAVEDPNRSVHTTVFF